MGRAKITVIGAGNVGASVAHECMRLGLGDIVLVDVAEGIAAGKALDLLESTPVLGLDVNVVGTTDYALTRSSDMIIITAGSARKPGMSRDDLLAINARVIRTVTESVAPLSPEARIIVVTNPVDVLCSEVMAISGFSPERMIGLGGVLDTSRFRTFIARELGVSVLDVHALVLGGHGDEMVPLIRHASVGNVPLSQLLPTETLARLVQRTRAGGGEIVNLLKSGSAYYAPAAAIAQMADAIVNDRKRLLPVSAYVTGQYGVKDQFLGVPAILGVRGVEQIVELPLEADEQAALARSAAAVRRTLESIRTTGG